MSGTPSCLDEYCAQAEQRRLERAGSCVGHSDCRCHYFVLAELTEGWEGEGRRLLQFSGQREQSQDSPVSPHLNDQHTFIALTWLPPCTQSYRLLVLEGGGGGQECTSGRGVIICPSEQ